MWAMVQSVCGVRFGCSLVCVVINLLAEDETRLWKVISVSQRANGLSLGILYLNKCKDIREP